MSDGGVCRTAPATPGLLEITDQIKCFVGSEKALGIVFGTTMPARKDFLPGDIVSAMI